MKITKALKMRIYPNKEQALKIDETIGSCRYIYNHMLARNKKIYARRNEHLSYYDMQNLLPHIKEYFPWLKKADSQALKHACRQLNTAYDRFFKKKSGFPKFHSKRMNRQAYTTTNKRQIAYDSENREVRLPFLGWMQCSDNRILSSPDFKYATVSRQNGKYYVSITYSIEKKVHPVAVSESQVLGLDYKSDGLYVDSNGNIATRHKFYRESQTKLAKEQRKLSRKKGNKKREIKSNNFLKQQKRVNKIHRHIANQRNDFLHKTSTKIANRYDVVAVEDLNMRSLSNKSFGNGKATMDNGYGMFLNMLEYKLNNRGKYFIKVDKFYPSSQTCHTCGYVNPEVKDLSIRKWVCPACGAVHDRDINAAINIRDEDLRLLSLA